MHRKVFAEEGALQATVYVLCDAPSEISQKVHSVPVVTSLLMAVIVSAATAIMVVRLTQMCQCLSSSAAAPEAGEVLQKWVIVTVIELIILGTSIPVSTGNGDIWRQRHSGIHP